MMIMEVGSRRNRKEEICFDRSRASRNLCETIQIGLRRWKRTNGVLRITYDVF